MGKNTLEKVSLLKVVFVSRYGSKNLGDELIVKELENLIEDSSIINSKFDFNLNLYEKTESGFDQKKNYNVKSINKSFYKDLYQKSMRKNYFIANLRNYINKNRAMKNENLELFREKLKEAELLIIGGGNAIYDTEKYSSSAFYFNLILTEAHLLKLPIFVINIGIGPFMTKRQIKDTITSLQKVNYITVRDEKSFDLVGSLNKENPKLFQTVDPVLFLKDRNGKGRERESVGSIGICVMDIRLAEYTQKQYRNYIEALSIVIKFYIENSKYKIILFCTELLDIVALYDLREIINSNNNRIVIKDSSDIESILKIYENVDLILGTRMHSTIISFSQNIPFIGIDWQQKVSEFFKVIDYKENLISIDDFSINPIKVINRLNDVANDYKNHKEKLENKKNELKPLLEINKEILNNIKFSSK